MHAHTCTHHPLGPLNRSVQISEAESRNVASRGQEAGSRLPTHWQREEQLFQICCAHWLSPGRLSLVRGLETTEERGREGEGAKRVWGRTDEGEAEGEEAEVLAGEKCKGPLGTEVSMQGLAQPSFLGLLAKSQEASLLLPLCSLAIALKKIITLYMLLSWQCSPWDATVGEK